MSSKISLDHLEQQTEPIILRCGATKKLPHEGRREQDGISEEIFEIKHDGDILAVINGREITGKALYVTDTKSRCFVSTGASGQWIPTDSLKKWNDNRLRFANFPEAHGLGLKEWTALIAAGILSVAFVQGCNKEGRVAAQPKGNTAVKAP